jgi:hypothetical protein
MYLTPLKAAIVVALRSTFTSDYPNVDFQKVYCSIEYPTDEANYPSIWVQYDDTAELTVAGIGHLETTIVPAASGTPAQFEQWTRWRFFGTVTLTIVALTSLERDRLYDEVVRMFAFAKQNPNLSPFRTQIEQNEFIAMNANFDDLRPFGDNAAPGTPWGTDDILYEKSISFNIQGEFTGDVEASDLVLLNRVMVQDYVDGQPEPTWPDEPVGGFDPTQWH